MLGFSLILWRCHVCVWFTGNLSLTLKTFVTTSAEEKLRSCIEQPNRLLLSFSKRPLKKTTARILLVAPVNSFDKCCHCSFLILSYTLRDKTRKIYHSTFWLPVKWGGGGGGSPIKAILADGCPCMHKKLVYQTILFSKWKTMQTSGEHANSIQMLTLGEHANFTQMLPWVYLPHSYGFRYEPMAKVKFSLVMNRENLLGIV